ncbi:hypothetical protein DMH04_18510 [Kibdelosporangium aridum]|uniref:Uncharacterized protein n=2 Tax=Kibdelosporangium aridum TaxID=2030 RepID=A0A428ZBB9_KIBAR|nr:hypothetical protein DMH04_18510 [Kibdelosporangium aridum]
MAMTDTHSSHAAEDLDVPSAVTTVIHDPLRDEILLRLTGAVMLPPGSLVDLPGGEIARVSAVRLNLCDAHNPTLVVHVTRSYRSFEGTP